jgi:hypothetical protein
VTTFRCPAKSATRIAAKIAAIGSQRVENMREEALPGPGGSDVPRVLSGRDVEMVADRTAVLGESSQR